MLLDFSSSVSLLFLTFYFFSLFNVFLYVIILSPVQVKENKLDLNNNESSCKNKNVVMVNGYSDTTLEVSVSSSALVFLRLLAIV